MSELIITEKPSTAKKIAAALDANCKTEKLGGVSYFRVRYGKENIYVVSAVGHLYTIIEAEKNGWTYPIFNVKWEASAKVNKESAFTNKYLTVIKKISKECNKFTIATDYDIEGEVIGHNILKYACHQKDGNRMKFSTVTKADLIKAYDHKMKTIDWGQARAGLTRHELDWYYGINLSRALTSAIKKAGYFKILSSGRVQGPTLKIIVEREKEIQAFKPEPYWQIQLLGKVQGADIEAWHKADKFWKEEEAQKVMLKTKGQPGSVIDLSSRSFQQAPPTPFDLTSLQMEAYRCFKINPKDTLSLAQELYSAGVISYPRTSSQVYPPEIGFIKIIQAISQMGEYTTIAKQLLSKKNLQPNNGNKTDPAHPAIYPTGLHPKKAEGRYKKIYDLIIRRFLATFGEPATRETMTITIGVNTEPFVASGTRTIDKGWHIYYGQYAKFKEIELPAVQRGDPVDISQIIKHDKETEPPRRYTPASIIKELEKKNLGTKATRAAIVDTLFNRGYVDGKSIQATDLGIQTVLTLQKYSPKIIDEELTSHFEEEMDQIREHKKKSEEVLDEAKNILTKILADFKSHEQEIGDGLKGATIESNTKANTIGKCKACSGNLMIKKGKFGSFIACSGYPDCKVIFKLPNYGKVKVTDKECETCTYPKIMVYKKRSSGEICINPECPSKIGEHTNLPEIREEKCPKCGSNMVLRKSIYGQFYGCTGYPKCRNLAKIGETNKDISERESKKSSYFAKAKKEGETATVSTVEKTTSKIKSVKSTKAASIKKPRAKKK